MRCFIKYKDTARDLWILINYQYAIDTNGRCIINVVSTNQSQVTVNLLFHKINGTNFISQKFSDSAVILAISVSKRCTLDLSVLKAQGLIAGFLFFLPFCHSRKIFTARVDFGIAFSIKFLSSSALLGFRKVLEQDAVSSSVSRRKVQNTCVIWFSCILIYN